MGKLMPSSPELVNIVKDNRVEKERDQNRN